MPGNTFIKFSDIAIGESFQAGHSGKDGWIEIGDWNWDMEAETSFTKGGGSAVGKPTPGNLSISHYFDLSSPTIMKKIVSGTHFPWVVIEMLKQTGDASGKPTVYFQIKMAEAFITKVSTKGGEDGAVNQDVEMVFKAIVVSYKAQDNKGKLGSAVPFKWNIAKMNADTAAEVTDVLA